MVLVYKYLFDISSGFFGKTKPMLGFMGNFDRFSRIDKLCGSLSINFGLVFDNKLREHSVKGWYIKAKRFGNI